MANSGIKQRTVNEFTGFTTGATYVLRILPGSVRLVIEKDRGPGCELTGSQVRVLFELLELANDEEGLS